MRGVDKGTRGIRDIHNEERELTVVVAPSNCLVDYPGASGPDKGHQVTPHDVVAVDDPWLGWVVGLLNRGVLPVRVEVIDVGDRVAADGPLCEAVLAEVGRCV